MQYLKSTTQKSYKFDGKTIPQAVTKDNAFLSLSDTDYNEFIKSPVIKSLINAGAIFVTDQEPSSPTKQVSNLTNENARLVLENTRLNEELKKAKSSDNSAEVESLKAALQKQIDDDTAEIKQLAEEKDAEIAALKKQLEEATATKSSKKKDAE